MTTGDRDNCGDITRALKAMTNGDQGAQDRVFELAYDELKRMSERQRRRGCSGDWSISATSLVHDLWLRLLKNGAGDFNSTKHFFATAAIVVQHLIKDHARRRNRSRHVRLDIDLSEAIHADLKTEQATHSDIEILDALDELEKGDAYLAKVVNLHFIAGVRRDDVAQILGASERTIDRDIEIALDHLRRSLK